MILLMIYNMKLNNVSLYAALEKVLTFPFIEGCKCFFISQMQSKLFSSFMYFKCVSIIFQLCVDGKMLTVRSICITVKANGLVGNIKYVIYYPVLF